MPVYATAGDLESRYGYVFSEDETTSVLILLEDASVLVDEVAGKSFDAPYPAVVSMIVCEAARRAFENPSGLSGETIGDYSWRASVGGAGVYLTESERRRVRRAGGKLGAGSLTLSSPIGLPIPSSPQKGPGRA